MNASNQVSVIIYIPLGYKILNYVMCNSLHAVSIMMACNELITLLYLANVLPILILFSLVYKYNQCSFNCILIHKSLLGKYDSTKIAGEI